MPCSSVCHGLARFRPNSALGRKRQTVATERLTVGEIIPAEGLGRFGLRPSQHLPLNAYVPCDWLQNRLEQAGRANAILLAEEAPMPRRLAARTDRLWFERRAY